MASDMYVQIDGVKGESTDSAHKDWIEIQSYSHSISQPASATANSAGGGTVGRCKHEDFVITKYIDMASAKLYELCCSGKHISKVMIDFMRASGGSPVKYLEIEMDQVVISKVSHGSVSNDDLPVESVSFNYGVIKWTYTQQKRADGSSGGKMAAGWDLTANKAAA